LIDASKEPKAQPEAEVLRETEMEAQFALEKKSELNPSLNKQFKTQDVDYKKIAQKDVGTEIKSVGKDRARKIRDTIVNGEAKKKSAKAIFNDVKKIGNYTDEETRRILNTEQINLTRHAKLQDAQNTGMKFKKWKAVKPRGCASCSAVCDALDGQVQPIDKEFKVVYKDKSGKTRRWKGMAPAAHPNCLSDVEFFESKPGGKK
jgi:hypothetical protein